MTKELIFIGADHGGLEYKERLVEHFTEKGYGYIRINDYKSQTKAIIDCGTYSADSVDYPDIAKIVSDQVIENNAKGILICGTGIGMSIAANKINGIRAALVYNTNAAKLAREHNDANIICFGQRQMDYAMVEKATDIFLKTDFEGGRHKRRVDMICSYEKD